MARRAMTLLELLLALSLLLALGAMVLPLALESLRERSFEADTEIIRNQLLLARAHAGATGRPVEILYQPDPSRIEARYFQAEPEQETARPAAAPRTASGEPADDPIVEDWAENLLRDGLTITAEPPGSAPGAAAVGEAPPVPRPLRLALFMPDGAALLSRPVWIGDHHGRQTKLTINPWTGLPAQEDAPAEEKRAGAPKKGDEP